METLDLDAFERSPLKTEPFRYIVVPGFIKAEALREINRDYPKITAAGNFPPQQLEYGPAFQTLLDELNSEELKRRYAEKFGVDLTPYPLQMTVRKYSEPSDGNVHNDSKHKILTSLIYFNETWPHAGGKLRLLYSAWNIERYAEEIEPVGGILLAFQRNNRSFHGYKRMEGERRSLQMYWVSPKRRSPAQRKRARIAKILAHVVKLRPR